MSRTRLIAENGLHAGDVFTARRRAGEIVRGVSGGQRWRKAIPLTRPAVWEHELPANWGSKSWTLREPGVPLSPGIPDQTLLVMYLWLCICSYVLLVICELQMTSVHLHWSSGSQVIVKVPIAGKRSKQQDH